MLKKWIALLLALCLLPGMAALAEGTADAAQTAAPAEAAQPADDWVTFLTICNEGMQNDGGNAGNTLMLIALQPVSGKVRLASITWDTFVNYEGYDAPQRLDQAYRTSMAADSMRVLNENFFMDVQHYMSINYLNLASLIDTYDGVTVDITRAERNALNAMVASKKHLLKLSSDSGLVSDLITELIAQEYYLNDFGPDTHLNGLQAVGFGWLQYDSVYNCCRRDLKVIASLFRSVVSKIHRDVTLYTNDTGKPVRTSGRLVNLDDPTEDDLAYFAMEIRPIFDKSATNLTEEEITLISLALVRASYLASRQGQDIFDTIETRIFPLEATRPYEYVAGVAGHMVDYQANHDAIVEFLYSE